MGFCCGSRWSASFSFLSPPLFLSLSLLLSRRSALPRAVENRDVRACSLSLLRSLRLCVADAPFLPSLSLTWSWACCSTRPPAAFSFAQLPCACACACCALGGVSAASYCSRLFMEGCWRRLGVLYSVASECCCAFHGESFPRSLILRVIWTTHARRAAMCVRERERVKMTEKGAKEVERESAV